VRNRDYLTFSYEFVSQIVNKLVPYDWIISELVFSFIVMAASRGHSVIKF